MLIVVLVNVVAPFRQLRKSFVLKINEWSGVFDRTAILPGTIKPFSAVLNFVL